LPASARGRATGWDRRGGGGGGARGGGGGGGGGGGKGGGGPQTTGRGGHVQQAPRAKRGTARPRHNAHRRPRVHSTRPSTAFRRRRTRRTQNHGGAPATRPPRARASGAPCRVRASATVEAWCGAPAPRVEPQHGNAPSSKAGPAWPHMAPARRPPRQRAVGHCAVDGGRGRNGAGQPSGANGHQCRKRDIVRHRSHRAAHKKE